MLQMFDDVSHRLWLIDTIYTAVEALATTILVVLIMLYLSNSRETP